MAIDYSAAMQNASSEAEWLDLLGKRAAKESQMKAAGTWNDEWIPSNELAARNPFATREIGSRSVDPAASYQKALDNALYDDIEARRKATAAQIKAQKEAMTPQYKAQRRQTAAQSELGKKSLAEYMAARGLVRAGEGIQSEINRQAALNNALTDINLQQAAAENALDLQALQSGLEYDAQAAQRQQALLQDTINYLRNQYNVDREFDEAQRQYNLGLALQQNALNWDRNADRAATLASVGYFDPYRELGYTDDDISRLTSAWQLANAPQASSGSGTRYRSAGGGGDKGTPGSKKKIPFTYDYYDKDTGNFIVNPKNISDTVANYVWELKNDINGYKKQNLTADDIDDRLWAKLQSWANSGAITQEQAEQIGKEIENYVK